MSGAARPTLNGKGMSWQWDKTSHGGIVLTGCEQSTWNDGIRQARLGDIVFCPKCKPHQHTISKVSGMNVHGVQSALEGDLTSCGAVLLAERASPDEIKHALRDHSKAHSYDQYFQIIDENTQMPAANRKYKITYSGGVVESTTDANGLTVIVKSDSPENVKLEVF